ncbi:archease [Halosegnis sp.]|uniref:archease n=1 Tax=Halosegnis sp. TaxID=2864959 RepID=UPI0035D4CAEE
MTEMGEREVSLREHTADVAIEATAPTLDGLFAAAGDGLTAAMSESVPPVGERFQLSAAAESLESLLFEYLAELIYQRDVREVLPCDHETTVRPPDEGVDHDWSVDASARGVPFGSVNARDVKAVTYSELSVAETASGWRAYVVLDV